MSLFLIFMVLWFFLGIDVWVIMVGILIKFFMLFKFFVKVKIFNVFMKGMICLFLVNLKEIMLLNFDICFCVILWLGWFVSFG